MKWYVEVVRKIEGEFPEEVIKKLTYSSEENAEHAERGVNRNLNHEKYYSRIVSEE